MLQVLFFLLFFLPSFSFLGGLSPTLPLLLLLLHLLLLYLNNNNNINLPL